MSGILIGEKHTETDWGLLWVDEMIPPAELITYTFAVPGKNGIIDVTERMGGVKYQNRELSFSFIHRDVPESPWHDLYSEIANYCHGKMMRIIIDSDPAYYWRGRVVVGSEKVDQMHSSLTILVDAEPFKYELVQSMDEWLWDPFSFTTGVIRNYKNLIVNTILNARIVGGELDVTPTIICSNPMKLDYEGVSYQLVSGKNRNYDIVLHSGDNNMTFTCDGTGTVSVEFGGQSL